MYQDGSDDKTLPSSSGTCMINIEMTAFNNVAFVVSRKATVNGDTFPFVMSLRLLDPDDTPVTSQFAPFAQSYDVSQNFNYSNVNLDGDPHILAYSGGCLICSRGIPEKPPS